MARSESRRHRPRSRSRRISVWSVDEKRRRARTIPCFRGTPDPTHPRMSTKSASLDHRCGSSPGRGVGLRGSGGRPLDDSELLAALARGDASAAAALHDRLRPQVDRTVRCLLGAARPGSQRLAQQAMIEIVLTVGRYRGDCSLDWWTSAVATHVVYKHIRHRRIERRIFDPLDAEIRRRSLLILPNGPRSIGSRHGGARARAPRSDRRGQGVDVHLA